MRAASNRKQGIHAELFHIGRVKNFAFQLELGGHRLRLLGQVARVANVGRQVAECFGQRHPLSDGDTLIERFFGKCQFIAPFDTKRQLAQLTANFILFALELIKLVSCIQRNHRGLANPPGDTAFFDGEFGQENGGVEGACLIERFDRSSHRITEFLLAEILFLAETDQQDAFAQSAGHLLQ